MSGFLAIYLTGLILGNHRHRAQQVISRFHDGLAWLAQIAMFLLMEISLAVLITIVIYGLISQRRRHQATRKRPPRRKPLSRAAH
ncbi:MAG: hypothetical protein EBR59_10845 [Methylococcaceae bacterium]|nr:hypothetical protein [Methylococcaceae bacterium]